MKNVFSRIIAAISVSVLAACAPQTDSATETGSVRVLAPMSNSKGSYSLDIFELKGITDLQTVAGKFVRFFLSPRIANKQLQGSAPQGRFIKNSDGAFIPANEMTQQLVTIYAHTQRLALLDEELGAGGVNKWPRDVGVAVKVRGGLTNNAFYDGNTDSMLLVPYSSEGLPIPINGGILAHEHFHSLFYKLVMGDERAQIHDRENFLERAIVEDLSVRHRRLLPISTGEEMSEAQMHMYYHLAIIRGLNEGLADYWGWMYTGDPDFIAQSLPSEKATRSLKVRDEKSVNSLPSVENIKRSLNIFYSGAADKARFSDYVTGYAYSLGTQFSRVLKRYTDIYSKARGIEDLQARKDIAKLIVKVLPKMKDDFDKLDLNYYTADKFLKSMFALNESYREEECQFLAEVISSSVATTEEALTCEKMAESEFKLVPKVEVAPVETPSVTESSLQ
ncbi:hypothetical protein AZI87_04115 [Bdellovibrio bacteriovorus]|uniref:Uncharacterized protein n=1 Tax=Bdellovibrio bacteriovorus TaxID=959 RepID=A0A162GLG7_BDEBC|nr:hypothetical protein [Bdellovibrio bacteriovorus]KYG68442.1 hypothetical protein AZI87_04115 [Bdellovibrio bacteriovorus]